MTTKIKHQRIAGEAFYSHRDPSLTGRTYHADITAARGIATWYDVHTRCWVTYITDEHGSQIGAAEYDFSVVCRDLSIAGFATDIRMGNI